MHRTAASFRSDQSRRLGNPQLSFTAVLGIALFNSRFAARGSEWIESSRRVPAIAKRRLTGIVYGMSVSIAATFVTAPLVAFYFGEVPVWGIPSTLLLVPVLPLFIGGSVLVAVAGALATEPVVAVSVIALGLGNYMSFIANTFASLPFGTVNAANEVSIALMAAWYGVLFALLHRRALSAIEASDGRFPQHWNRWNNCHRNRAEPEKKSIHIHSDRCLADRGRFTDWLRPHGFVTP